MNAYCIKGAKVLVDGKFEQLNVSIKNNTIVDVSNKIKEGSELEIDASGLLLVPGFVDIHCHLREPGFEYKEDIYSGTKAAVKGGFTSVCCMANTKPVNDSATTTLFIKEQAKKAGFAKVYPVAAVTLGLDGQVLTNVAALKESGAIALSDDGRSVKNANIMRLALRQAKDYGLCIMSHPEDTDLVAGGVINEGTVSKALSLAGISRLAEETIIARDIMLAHQENAHIHIAHVSTAGGVDIVREAKKRGINVTCETAPHYLLANDTWINTNDASTKVNPPLRTEADTEALIAGIKDGTIDCIATDHAPHHYDDKNVDYKKASPGISGFETAFSICWTVLVLGNHISAEKLFYLMSQGPAKIVSLDMPEIAVGKTADLVLLDPQAQWVVNPQDFVSKGKNSPFKGTKLTGLVTHTFVNGKLVYQA